ncbi:MAG: SprB repeat-containing protein [Sphingobacteriales bacterium]|nr:SprB repeat-containing protein [Sphingobacteriales bacterium]
MPTAVRTNVLRLFKSRCNLRPRQGTSCPRRPSQRNSQRHSTGAGATTQNVNSLAGTYSVTITETPTCTAVASYTVTEPSAALDATCSKTDVTTNGGADGTASVSASGGTSPYTYLWNTGATTQSISGLTAGTYSVTVTDANGCTDECTTTVQEPGCNLTASASGTNVLCNGGADGTASATASGNTGAVTYLWSNGATTASISSLAVGTYSVTITETPTCTAVASYTVTEPSAALDATCSKTDVTTNGGADGTASVSASGGTSPYTYLWNTGATTSSISGLVAGTYSVTVTDANGCTDECTTTVQEPGCSLTASASGTNVLCNGGADGTATATASGNTGAVTYLWSNGATTASISSLAVGTYSVTITETPTCTAVASYTVTEPSAALDATCSKTDVTTNGGADGTASVSASGGTSPTLICGTQAQLHQALAAW